MVPVRMTSERDKTIRLLLAMEYEGPWQRLEQFLLGINPKTLELRWEVGQSPWNPLGIAAAFCGRRDRAWMNRWVARWPERTPNGRWSRKRRPDVDI